MSELFDRYFLILAGRIAGGECGAAASLSPAGSGGGCSLGWPLDLPDDSVPEIARAAELIQPKTQHDAE
jgi:hypothetical protein